MRRFLIAICATTVLAANAYAVSSEKYFAAAKGLGLNGCVRALDHIRGVIGVDDVKYMMWRIPYGVAIAATGTGQIPGVGLPMPDFTSSGTVLHTDGRCYAHHTTLELHDKKCADVIRKVNSDRVKQQSVPTSQWTVRSVSGATTWVTDQPDTDTVKSIMRLIDGPKGTCIVYRDSFSITNPDDGTMVSDMIKRATQNRQQRQQ